MLHRVGAEEKEEWGNQGLTSAVTNTVKVSAAIKGVANRKKRLPSKMGTENANGKCCACAGTARNN
jgi:hypothetical protein